VTSGRVLRSAVIKLHEFQARELLSAYGIPIPAGQVARTAEEAGRAAAKWQGKAMIKAQGLTGGRGKAGAIGAAASQQEAHAWAERILGMSVKGYPVDRVLVTERVDIQAEYYAGITIDREAKAVVLILSAAGGMDIEDIAAHEPEKIRRLPLSGPDAPADDAALMQWLAVSFEEKPLQDQAVSIVQNMLRLFRDKDCSLVEINPLAVVRGRDLLAADAKIVLDDNGIPLHSELDALRNPEEYTPDELDAKEADLSYVSLSGEIGCMVNGAGLAMATMDGIKLAGGSPANFLDVGGSSNPQKVLDAMRILVRNPSLKVILINIFGGITRCDDVAQGILWARDQLNLSVPMVIRLIGTNEPEGHAMLRGAGLTVRRHMTEAITEAVQHARGGSRP